MPVTGRAASRQPKGIEFFSVWVITWAFITFASAAVQARGPEGWNLLAYAKAVFAVADAVPPAAKISFGAALAVAIYVGTITRVLWTPLATPVAFFLCLSVLPVSYYPSFDAQCYFPGHFLAAVVGGLVPVASHRRH